MTAPYIHFARPDYTDAEIGELVDAVRSGWLTTGPRTMQFQDEFRAYTGAAHALAVNSCTAGLHLALAALGIGPGDEVITSPLTFCATANVIRQVGATPVLADVGADLNLDPSCVRRCITKATKAIMPVHLAGLPCEMDLIWQMAAEYGLKVAEDAAHAIGTEYHGTRIGGGRSDAVAFSFYATKNLSTGEGGMVTTPHQDVLDRMRTLCLHGISRDAWNRYSEQGNWYYEVVDCGFKYNMSDLAAAIGIHQLRRLDSMNQRREQIAMQYNAAFADMPELQITDTKPECRHSWHLYVLRLSLDALAVDRAAFIEELRRKGIGASVHFIPLQLHPYYKRELELRDSCATSLREYPRLVSLPMYSAMEDGQVSRVISAVQDIVRQTSLRRSVARAS